MILKSKLIKYKLFISLTKPK